MKRSPRSRRLRAVLIPLNFVLVTGMLLSLALGAPSVTIAGAMIVTSVASIIAVIFER